MPPKGSKKGSPMAVDTKDEVRTEELSSLSQAELRKKLSDRGMAAYGSKDDMIKRLLGEPKANAKAKAEPKAARRRIAQKEKAEEEPEGAEPKPESEKAELEQDDAKKRKAEAMPGRGAAAQKVAKKAEPKEDFGLAVHRFEAIVGGLGFGAAQNSGQENVRDTPPRVPAAVPAVSVSPAAPKETPPRAPAATSEAPSPPTAPKVRAPLNTSCQKAGRGNGSQDSFERALDGLDALAFAGGRRRSAVAST